MRGSLERLSKNLMGRKMSFDAERSNETFGCRAKVGDLEVDPSLPFDLDSLGGKKTC